MNLGIKAVKHSSGWFLVLENRGGEVLKTQHEETENTSTLANTVGQVKLAGKHDK